MIESNKKKLVRGILGSEGIVNKAKDAARKAGTQRDSPPRHNGGGGFSAKDVEAIVVDYMNGNECKLCGDSFKHKG